MVQLYRAVFISQYFKIMQTINYIEEQELERDDKTEQTFSSDSLVCDETTKDLSLTYWCDNCDKSTYYCKKPPKDYPHQLCLSDDCIAQYIVGVVVQDHEKKFNHDEFENAENEIEEEDEVPDE